MLDIQITCIIRSSCFLSLFCSADVFMCFRQVWQITTIKAGIRPILFLSYCRGITRRTWAHFHIFSFFLFYLPVCVFVLIYKCTSRNQPQEPIPSREKLIWNMQTFFWNHFNHSLFLFLFISPLVLLSLLLFLSMALFLLSTDYQHQRKNNRLHADVCTQEIKRRVDTR